MGMGLMPMSRIATRLNKNDYDLVFVTKSVVYNVRETLSFIYS